MSCTLDRVRVKICGITNEEDALAAVEAGADAVGFIFYERSPRFVQPDRVRQIVSALPPFVATVGVFVNEAADRINETIRVCGLSAAQLHGDESPEYCTTITGVWIKAFRVQDASWREVAAKYPVQAVLLDTYAPDKYGGTGRTFDWNLVSGSPLPIILSGGLNPENVAEAIRQACPYAVDTSSGVEREPGRKDHDRVRAFVEAVKQSTAR